VAQDVGPKFKRRYCKKTTKNLQKNKAERTEGMAQVVEHLPNKRPEFKPHYLKKKKKKN
jgi:hypothetical protein